MSDLEPLEAVWKLLRTQFTGASRLVDGYRLRLRQNLPSSCHEVARSRHHFPAAGRTSSKVHPR